MRITAGDMYFKELNEAVRNSSDREIVIDQCVGQRFIAAGISDKNIIINGTPGNALGAYLNGAHINVNGNAQDATGDTMNEGEIVINGSSGDATGYAMRGGAIYVRDSVGYRAGIHMKAYKEKFPVLVIGGSAGSFLGEYQAGGLILVLGVGKKSAVPAGYFCGTGMHGGMMALQCDEMPQGLPEQVVVSEADEEAMAKIEPYITRYCELFGADRLELLNKKYYILVPDTKNPYKQLYTYN